MDKSAEIRTDKSTKKSYREVKILLKLPLESNQAVDQMFTEADFQRWLPRQRHITMTTGCKIYSPELGQRKLAWTW